MIEAIIPISVALIGCFATVSTRLHNRIADLDRRVDAFELRIAESYFTKADFNLALERCEDRWVRMESKIDHVNRNCTP